MSADAEVRRRHAEVLPEPLFDTGAITGHTSAEPHPAPPRAVDWATCTVCRRPKVGLYVAGVKPNGGRVLAFKAHYRSTFGGVALRCAASDTEPGRKT